MAEVVPDRRAILHIGPTKTGTTSIQSWLASNRQALLEQNVFVPRSFGSNHSELVSWLTAPGAASGRHEPGRFENFKAELANLPPDISDVVLTGEWFGENLRSVADIQLFKSFTDRFAKKYLVVIYLRRQDLKSVSRYSTRLRLARNAELLDNPFDYARTLVNWSEVFGREAIVPRIFERQAMIKCDVVADFISVACLPELAYDPTAVVRENSSLSAPAQELLKLVSEKLIADGNTTREWTRTALHHEMLAVLNAHFSDDGILPTRGDALAFYEKCIAGNERVRRGWFPEQTTLFSMDFDKYPESASPPPTSKEVLDVAVAALAWTLQIAQQEAARKRHRARARTQSEVGPRARA